MEQQPTFMLYKGDCLESLKSIESNSIDSVICDPPYHLQSINKRYGGLNSSPPKFGTDGLFQRASKGFMNKTWDGGDIAFRIDVWKECYRVLKPGGHLAAFGGTRTIHRITCAIEDSGFEIRDLLAWITYQGFPKSRNISLDIDKMQLITKPSKQYAGIGTALKPSHEPATIARKPLEPGLTVAKNVLKWGTGGLNIDKCRIKPGDPAWPGPNEKLNYNNKNNSNVYSSYMDGSGQKYKSIQHKPTKLDSKSHPLGRWPANIYQCPKPSRKEKEAGLSHLNPITGAESVNRKPDSAGINNPRAGAGRTAEEIRNTHPTIKPQGIMSFLINLLTPPGGTVLDPFAGSGTTGVSAIIEGYNCILCELTPEYWPIINGRLDYAMGVWFDKNRQYKLF
jgi:site-specific DNA-methyltransferase (adenine-specific)